MGYHYAVRITVVVLLCFGYASHAASQEKGDPAWLRDYLEASELAKSTSVKRALAKSESAYQSYVAVYGERGIDFAYIAYLVGTLHIRDKSYGKAMPPIEKAYELISADLLQPSEAKAALATTAGMAAFQDYQYQKSADYFGKALEFYAATDGQFAEKEVTVRLDRAGSLMSIDPEFALSELEKAATQADGLFPKRGHVRSTIAIYSARALISLGRLKEAKKLLQKAQRAIPNSRRSQISGYQRWILQDQALIFALEGKRTGMLNSYSSAGVRFLNPSHMAHSRWEVTACVQDQDGSLRDDWAVLELDVGSTGQLARAELIAFGPPGDTRFVSDLLQNVRSWEFEDGLATEPVELRSLLRFLIRCNPLTTKSRGSIRHNLSRNWQRSFFELPTGLVSLGGDETIPELSTAFEEVRDAEQEYKFGHGDNPARLREALSAALTIAVQNYGEQSPLLINYYRNLGRLALDQRDINEAERHIAVAIKMARQQKSGQYSDEVAGAFWDYASCAALLDHRDNVVTASDALIETLERLGRPQAEIVDAKLRFASHFMWLRNKRVSKKVKAALNDVISITGQDADSLYTERLRAASILASITRFGGAADESLRQYINVESMALERLSENNIFVIDARRGQAESLVRSGELDKARAVLNSIIVSSRDIGESSWSPISISRPHPYYPRDLQLRSISGFAFAQSEIDENGEPSDPRILVSYPPFLFERATLKAMQNARYLSVSTEEQSEQHPAAILFTYEIVQ